MFSYIENRTQSSNIWILRYTENKKYLIGFSYWTLIDCTGMARPLILMTHLSWAIAFHWSQLTNTI